MWSSIFYASPPPDVLDTNSAANKDGEITLSNSSNEGSEFAEGATSHGDIIEIDCPEFDWGQQFLDQLFKWSEISKKHHSNSSIESEIKEYYGRLSSDTDVIDDLSIDIHGINLGENITSSRMNSNDDFAPLMNIQDSLNASCSIFGQTSTPTSSHSRNISKPKRNDRSKKTALNSTPPVCNVINDMVHWYVHSSIRDIVWKISVSSEDEIPLLVECLLDLPIQDNVGCYSYLRSRIYDKLMKAQEIPVTHQVKFWTAVHMLSLENNQTTQRLLSDLDYQIGTTFKNMAQNEQHQLLVDDNSCSAYGSSEQSSSLIKMQFSFFQVLKFAHFVTEIWNRPIFPRSRMLDNLLHICECSDVKSLTLLVAVLHKTSNILDNILSLHEKMFLLPLNINQKAIIQIYAKLRAIVNMPPISMPRSMIRFVNGLVYQKAQSIHNKWRMCKNLDISNPKCFILSGREELGEENNWSARTETTESRRHGRSRKFQHSRSGSPRLYRIAPIPTFKTVTESLLHNELIDKFYGWLLKKYLKLQPKCELPFTEAITQF